MSDRGFFTDYLAAWGAGDVDGLLAWFTDDVEFRDMTTRHGASGIDRMRRFVEAAFSSFPDARFELVDCVSDGRSFAMEWVMRPGDVPGASFGRLVGGRVAVQHDYWDGRLVP
ncbi:MAG: nuclear transport factor 2 family protein [Acidimicrobiia bacterium]